MAIWRRRHERPSAATEDARRRLEQAVRALRDAERDNTVVDDVARRLRDLGCPHRFGSLIVEALRGGQ